MYQDINYRASGRTTRLLAYAREINGVFIYPTNFGRKLADIKGYTDVEVMSYREVLEKGLPKDKPYVIDDIECFIQQVVPGGKLAGYSGEKTIPDAIRAEFEPMKVLLNLILKERKNV